MRVRLYWQDQGDGMISLPLFVPADVHTEQ
jgi:hypothetical protein